MLIGHESSCSRNHITEEETKLRGLLLAVANYIDHAPGSQSARVSVPDNVAQEKTVLRWTGGWVRDKLLRVGSHDVDVAALKFTHHTDVRVAASAT